MKKLLLLAVVCLFIGMTAMTLASQDRGGNNDDIRGRFIGAWRLVWLEEEGVDGKVHRADCTGRAACLQARRPHVGPGDVSEPAGWDQRCPGTICAGGLRGLLWHI
jgi:hypothetical protein